MSDAQILSWVLGLIGITGFFLAGRKYWWCWYLNIACQVFWIWYAIASDTPAFIVTALFYAVVFSINARKWTKEHFQKKREQVDVSAFGTQGQFKKKPFVVDAMQVNFHDNIQIHEIMKWAGDEVQFFNYDPMTNCFYACRVETLEGTMTALEGDWIIRGVNGEFYPCKPDIFEKSFAKVGDSVAHVPQEA